MIVPTFARFQTNLLLMSAISARWFDSKIAPSAGPSMLDGLMEMCSVTSRVKSSALTQNGSWGVPYCVLCEWVLAETLDNALDDDLHELRDWALFCSASWHALAAVWVSIFTASTDRGVVPTRRANSSRSLLSLSHRYTSPL